MTVKSGVSRRIGVLGGTLDPIHYGHLRAAEEVREACRLDELLLIPAASPPHKAAKSLAPFEHRLEMARIAIEGLDGWSVSAMEGLRTGPSYTVETLRALKEIRPQQQIFFMVGADAFLDFGSWKEYDRIPGLLHELVVFSRPGTSWSEVVTVLETIFGQPDVVTVPFNRHGRLFLIPGGGAVRLLDVTALDISSTVIRQRVRTGLSIRFLLPDKVIDYMTEKAIYEKKKDLSAKSDGPAAIDSEEMARAIHEEIENNKGEKTVVLDMRGVSPVADFFVITQGRSTRHVQGMASRMRRDLSRKGIKCRSIEGEDEGKWILMDFDDVVVHLFYEPIRAFYDLEGLWHEAPRMPWAWDDKGHLGSTQDDE